MKFFREPLLHFMLIGAAIYLLYGVFAEDLPEADEKTISVSAGEIEWMLGFWQQRWNRPPTKAEFDGLVQQYIRETVLYREALTMGLNQHDQVIRRRLAQKLEFLAKDLVALTPPTEQELQAYFVEQEDRYKQPPLYTFTQVYLDPDKRGDSTLQDAETIMATLIAGGNTIEDPGALGDGFMLQNYYPEKTPIEIQKSFGSGFSELLFALSPGQWHGPIISGYGVHIVYVNHIKQPPEPDFGLLRERVTADWKIDKGEELNESFYQNLREQYSVVMESPIDENRLLQSKVSSE